MTYVEDREQVHRALGCYECKFAARKALGKDACCTYYGKIGAGPDGKCVSCKPRKVSIPGNIRKEPTHG